jgi:hypothetical protein
VLITKRNRRRIHGRLIRFQPLVARQSIAFPDARKLVPQRIDFTAQHCTINHLLGGELTLAP